MAKKKERWYAPSERTGWRKTDSQSVRRRTILKSRGGDLLAAARALGALANVNTGPKGDKETERKARADAQYFYGRYRRRKK